MRKLQKLPSFKLLVSVCTQALELDMPVDIILGRKVKGFPDWCGCHRAVKVRKYTDGYIYRHRVYISLDNCAEINQDIFAIVAHEFVHAYCVEYHPKAATHGRTFQRKAAALRRCLRGFGLDIGPIFRQGLDV